MSHPHTRAAAELVHAVGKYISRTARNLPKGPIPDGFAALMLKDLYETDGSRRASQLFELLAVPLEGPVAGPKLDTCRTLLKEIDALETDIRNGDDRAIRRAGAAAMKVDTLLREIRRQLGTP